MGINPRLETPKEAANFEFAAFFGALENQKAEIMAAKGEEATRHQLELL